jgi:hypothetical protein
MQEGMVFKVHTFFELLGLAVIASKVQVAVDTGVSEALQVTRYSMYHHIRVVDGVAITALS